VLFLYVVGAKVPETAGEQVRRLDTDCRERYEPARRLLEMGSFDKIEQGPRTVAAPSLSPIPRRLPSRPMSLVHHSEGNGLPRFEGPTPPDSIRRLGR
jgi:hypothetical protein